jgi:prepilin-type N-terminal cleavage/methylation domain-containing protein
MKYLKYKAFTLVELIVVVTILAILATIGFVSYSSYLVWVRDTNRLAQLVSIHDGLELYRTQNDLPLPDDNVEVQVNGELIAYQWYVWANTLETIDFTKGWQDPRDKQYFTYYLTEDRKYFQLMWFLEENTNAITQSNLLKVSYAADYSNRIPTVYGKKLWVLTDTNNTPIQEIGDIDLSNTTENFKLFYEADDITEWDSDTLITRLTIERNELSYLDDSLIIYYKLDNPINNYVDDYSGNGNNGIFWWNIEFNKSYWYAEDNWDPRSAYIQTPITLNLSSSDYTLLAMTYLQSDRPTWHNGIFWHWSPWTGELLLLTKESSLFNYSSNWSSWQYGGGKSGYNLDEWVHYGVTTSTDGNTQMFHNWVGWSVVDIWSFPNANIVLNVMSYWNGGIYSLDKIDEVRVYNRKLTEDEIQKIHNKMKKKYKYDMG